MSDTYKPKVVRARLVLPFKEWEQYREKYKGQGFTVNNFKAMQKADQYFNGLELYLASWAYDNHEVWHLWNWDKEDDERVKLAFYHAEQFKPGTTYKNEFERFCTDWAAGTYDPGMVYTFEHNQVEVLEVLQEEENNIPAEQKQKTARQLNRAREYQDRKRATKRKYRYKKHR